MANAERIYWLHALSPLHVGTGKGEGYIDLPLAREKVSGFPYVPGSSVKGVFADACEATDEIRSPKSKEGAPNPRYKKHIHAAFGLGGDDNASAGALVFTDARLICLPVRSLYGTFAWCTSRMVLRRLSRDLVQAGGKAPPVPAEDGELTLVPGPQIPSALIHGSKIYLEDLDLDCDGTNDAKEWGELIASQVFPKTVTKDNKESDSHWVVEFTKRFAILPDSLFDHLSQTGTEVQPHVRIDPDFKRVDKGALWYEESLPAESILCGLVWSDGISDGDLKKNVMDLLTSRLVQMGGKSSVGKGRVSLQFFDSSAQGSAPQIEPAGDNS